VGACWYMRCVTVLVTAGVRFQMSRRKPIQKMLPTTNTARTTAAACHPLAAPQAINPVKVEEMAVGIVTRNIWCSVAPTVSGYCRHRA